MSGPRPWLAVGPVLLVAGGAVLAGITLHPMAERILWEGGVLYVVRNVDRVLPLLGLACALGQLESRRFAVALLLLIAGLAAGLAAEPRLMALIGSRHDLWTGLLLATGPLSCLLAGIALAAPARLRPWLLLPVAPLVGAQLGIAVQLDGPALGASGFTAAAIAAAWWLVLAVSLTWHRFSQAWFAIAGRILGSWLMAIGLLLGGAMLVPKPQVAMPTTPSATLTIPFAPQPGGYRPFPPEAPSGNPDFDPSRQP